jgi:ribosomal protein L11 methylase PrmA
VSSSLKRTHNFFSKHPITQGALTSAWIRFGWWQFVSRLKKEIIFDWIEGQRLIARRGMTGATGNIYTGLHEFTDMMLPLHFLRSGDLFLDIGANVGSYSVLASGVCGATTWAFEPDPEAASTLQRNIEVNRLESLVTVHHVALGSEPGEVPFSVGMDTTNQVLQSS